jgi:D-alanine-D-alanine ligase
LRHKSEMDKKRIALTLNSKYNTVVGPDAPADALAEYDSAETVHALTGALQAGGHEVIPLEADETLLDTVREVAPDICFNIAEGLRGDARESHVPALLEMLGIPYTGSKVLTHALSLDKAAAKRIWRDLGLPTAPFQVFYHGDEILDWRLPFPLFVKPVREGSGMGINSQSVVHDRDGLQNQVRWVIDSYRQPALVETYLPGREFTVGLIGNSAIHRVSSWNSLYDEQGFHIFPVLEINAHVGVGKGLYNSAAKAFVPGEAGAPLYLCPADIPQSLENELRWLAVAAFTALDGLDVGRVDFRLDGDGRPHIIEINTLPGINPVVSDLCIMAHAGGMPYVQLVNEILDLALDRYARERRPLVGRVTPGNGRAFALWGIPPQGGE